MKRNDMSGMVRARSTMTIDRTLAALADPHRRQVVELLRQSPRPAGELARAVGITPPAMSRHLRLLRESQIVEEAAGPFDARLRIYRLKPRTIAQLRAWLEETERLWTSWPPSNRMWRVRTYEGKR